MKAYTVSQINALRQACENKYLYGCFNPTFGSGGVVTSRCFLEAEKNKSVEEQVRTYMLAGITASELLASEVAA